MRPGLLECLVLSARLRSAIAARKWSAAYELANRLALAFRGPQ